METNFSFYPNNNSTPINFPKSVKRFIVDSSISGTNKAVITAVSISLSPFFRATAGDDSADLSIVVANYNSSFLEQQCGKGGTVDADATTEKDCHRVLSLVKASFDYHFLLKRRENAHLFHPQHRVPTDYYLKGEKKTVKTSKGGSFSGCYYEPKSEEDTQDWANKKIFERVSFAKGSSFGAEDRDEDVLVIVLDSAYLLATFGSGDSLRPSPNVQRETVKRVIAAYFLQLFMTKMPQRTDSSGTPGKGKKLMIIADDECRVALMEVLFRPLYYTVPALKGKNNSEKPSSACYDSSIMMEGFARSCVSFTWVKLLAPSCLYLPLTEAEVRAGSDIAGGAMPSNPLCRTHPSSLSLFCMAVLVGAVQTVRGVRKGDSLHFTPLDVAVNTGLLSLAELLCYNDGTHCTNPQDKILHKQVSMQMKKPCILGFEMLSLYLLDYYARSHDAIKKEFKKSARSGVAEAAASAVGESAATKASRVDISFLVDTKPCFRFPLSCADVNDVVFYGLTGFSPITSLYDAESLKRRNELVSRYGSQQDSSTKRFFGSVDSVVAKIGNKGNTVVTGSVGSAVQHLPNTLYYLALQQMGLSPTEVSELWRNNNSKNLTHNVNNSSASESVNLEEEMGKNCPLSIELFLFDKNSYFFLVSRLTEAPNDMQNSALKNLLFLQFVQTESIHWEYYIKVVARANLLNLVDSYAAPEAPGAFIHRFPTVECFNYNDFMFDPSKQAPAFSSLARRLLPFPEWAVKAGVNFTGSRPPNIPGLTPERVELILEQPHIQQLFERVLREETAAAVAQAEENGGGGNKQPVTREALKQRARAILIRMGDRLSTPKFQTAGSLLSQVFPKLLRSISFFRKSSLMKVNRLFSFCDVDSSKNIQLVIVPLHRSYLDFLVMSFILGMNGISAPHIVAGEDFLKMGVMVHLLRGCGAFFMKRSFKADDIDVLYGPLFREYVRQLVLHKQTMEFFIEGTRSRTGKVMTPKLGILKFICDSFYGSLGATHKSGRVHDVWIVPVSFSYDELLESHIYAKEMLGIPKPKETIANLLSSLTTILNEQHGSISVNVGDPISLLAFKSRDVLQSTPENPRLQVSASTTAPTAGKKPVHTPPKLLQSLGWAITKELEDNIMVSTTALLAAVVETFYPSGDDSDEGIPVAAVRAHVEWLRDRVAELGGILAADATVVEVDGVETGVASGEVITRRGLRHLNRFLSLRPTGQVSDEDAAAVVYHCSVSPTNSKSTATEGSNNRLIARLGVNIATNQLIHVFVHEAVVAVAVHAFSPSVKAATGSFRATSVSGRAEKADVKLSVVKNHCFILVQLLSQEFPDFLPSAPYTFESWFDQTLQKYVRFMGAGSEGKPVDSTAPLLSEDLVVENVVGNPLQHFLSRLLFPHVECIFVAVATINALFSVPKSNGEELRYEAKPVVVSARKAAMRFYNASTGSRDKDKGSEASESDVPPPTATGQDETPKLVHFAIACNQETIQHYMDSLIQLSLLKVSRFKPKDADDANSGSNVTASAPGGGKKRRSSPLKPHYVLPNTSASKAGDDSTSARLKRLLVQVNAMRFVPSTDLERDMKAVKTAVLHNYMEEVMSSKY